MFGGEASDPSLQIQIPIHNPYSFDLEEWEVVVVIYGDDERMIGMGNCKSAHQFMSPGMSTYSSSTRVPYCQVTSRVMWWTSRRIHLVGRSVTCPPRRPQSPPLLRLQRLRRCLRALRLPPTRRCQRTRPQQHHRRRLHSRRHPPQLSRRCGRRTSPRSTTRTLMFSARM